MSGLTEHLWVITTAGMIRADQIVRADSADGKLMVGLKDGNSAVEVGPGAGAADAAAYQLLLLLHEHQNEPGVLHLRDDKVHFTAFQNGFFDQFRSGSWP